MTSLIKNIALAIGFGLILVLGYYLFFRNTTDLSTEEITANQASIQGQLFLAQIAELENVNLDTPLFTDARFATLIDFRIAETEEPYGRSNPFDVVPELLAKKRK